MSRAGVRVAMQDQRGIALPMALLALVLLTSMSIAFVTLGRTEPIVATNHVHAAQARALAEAGIEMALWASSVPTDPNGIPTSLRGRASSPYDGTALFPLSGSVGQFAVAVEATTGRNVRRVTSVGYAPSADGAGRARRRIVAQLVRVSTLAIDVPCALCVNGPMTLTGSMRADARASGECGPKAGAASTSTMNVGGAAELIATDGTENVEGVSYLQNQTFEFLLSKTPVGESDVDTLRELAKRSGTYIKPTSTSAYNLPRVRDGIVLVDTVDGSNLATSANKANVEIGAGWASPGPFRGWLVVLGDVRITGEYGGIHGLLYVQGALNTAGMGHSAITGLTIVENVMGVANFTPGNADFVFDCMGARGVTRIPQGWFVKPGSWSEPAS